MCNKVKHSSRDVAMMARRRQKNAQLEPYLCPTCKCWHLRNSRMDYKIQRRIDQLLGKRKGM